MGANRTVVESSQGMYLIDLQAKQLGTHILAIYHGVQQIPNSPFRFVVLQGNCQNGSGRVPDVSGNCVCPPSTHFDVVGTEACIAFHVFLPALIVPILFLFGVAIICTFQYSIARQGEASWSINEAEIVYTDPKEILGAGSNGPVFKAEYRGTYVAVKRFTCRTENSVGSPIRSAGSVGRRGTRVEPTPVTTSTDETPKRVSSSGRGSDFTEKAKFTSGMFNRSLYSYYMTEESATLRAVTFNQLHQDIKTLVHLRHPFLTTVMGAMVIRTGRQREIHMIMELMELGNLWDLLRNEMYPIQAGKALRFLRDVAQGMHFLHDAQPACVHGDLKSANILIDRNFCAKLSDYGLASNTPTTYWAAPECLMGQLSSVKSDVYSFGVVVYEVLSRKVPYNGQDWQSICAEVSEGTLKIPVPAGCSPQVSVLMNECLLQDPLRRPPFAELKRRLDALDETLMTSIAFSPAHDMRAQLKRKSTVMRIAPDSTSLGRHSMLIMRDLFPPNVAESLMRGEKVPPERKEAITMYFSDIVGFTNISASISPEKVNSLLDRLYDRLDSVAEGLGVYKIETIGDAYLCAANVVQNQANTHAFIMAQFAVAAQQAAAETLIDEEEPSRGPVRIRVGLSSGPCMASVVGHRNPKYTLFGDTINTASRMESSSVAGYIQCSQRTADLLREQDPGRLIHIELRGRVRIKGKGDMITYWILLPGQVPPIPGREPS